MSRFLLFCAAVVSTCLIIIGLTEITSITGHSLGTTVWVLGSEVAHHISAQLATLSASGNGLLARI